MPLGKCVRDFASRCRARMRIRHSKTALQPSHARVRRIVVSFNLALLLVKMLSMPCGAASAAVCGGCELSLGIGDTYHFWGRTGGLVLPATLTWDQGRYEVGVFRMASDQKLYEDTWGRSRVLAEPYWGISASRRWRLITRPTWWLFFGFRASYKTKEDLLNGTHWNFASQLTLRLHHPTGKGSDMEFAIRHWSNAGIRSPNRGQDFFTVTIAF